jgi:hypothetical protein
MVDDQTNLREETDDSHEKTLELIKETDNALKVAQEVISNARKKLKYATEKYEERLYGPEATRTN